MATNAMGLMEWDAMTKGDQWLFLLDLISSNKAIGRTLEAKTKSLANHKKVIGNNIESMQRRDNRICAQDAEIVDLKAKLASEIQSNKTREGILWARAREEKCKKCRYFLAQEGKAALDEVKDELTIFQRRGFCREQKERKDKRGQLLSPQDKIWVRYYFVKKVLKLEAGKLNVHDMTVIWP